LEAATAQLSRVQSWIAARGRWQRWGIALLAGAFATLGHAPFQIVPAYVAAISVFILLLDEIARRPKRLGAAFALGWFFALGHYITGFYWVASAFQVDAETWGVMGAPAVLALAGGLALFWGLACVLAMLLWTRDLRRIPAFALAVIATEWLRGNVFGGFPWLLPGYVWTPGEPISQLASIFGIYGLSAITIVLAAAPAVIADGGVGAGRRFAPTIAAALSFGLIWGWGAQRIAHAPVDAPGALPIVRVADSGLSQAQKWQDRPDQEWRVLDQYLRASGSSEESRASILIWPEGAIPVVNFYPLENQNFLDEIGRGLGDRVLVTGMTRRELRGADIVHFNSAIVIDGVSGRARIDQTQIYDKHRLVPFGEFIPLWPLVSKLNIAPLQQIGAGFEPGPMPTRLVIPEAPPAIVLICYEAIFPGMIPRGANERPGWIISITNDAWFGNGTGPAQHYVAARYRAIEEGLPLARAASGGVSAIIDSFGRAVSETHRRGGFAEAQIPPSLPPTPYAKWGVSLILLLVGFIATLRFAPFAALRSKER
jgi:apolipoprotein N-acyltransferase